MTADIAAAWVLILLAAGVLACVELAKHRRAKRAVRKGLVESAHQGERNRRELEELLRRIRREERDRPTMGDFDV